MVQTFHLSSDTYLLLVYTAVNFLNFISLFKVSSNHAESLFNLLVSSSLIFSSGTWERR